jgi:uncharacterized C2H2 Zn-finger protein
MNFTLFLPHPIKLEPPTLVFTMTTTIPNPNPHGYVEEKDADGSMVFRCGRCSKVFSHRGMMNRHLKVHQFNGSRGVAEQCSCTTCGQTFLYKSSMDRHRQRVHSTKLAFSCRVCNRRYRYKSSLDHHMMVHDDLRPHECEVCGKSCRTKHKLAEHMQVHTIKTSGGRIRCSRGCGQEFASTETWLKHHHEQPLCAFSKAFPLSSTPETSSPLIDGDIAATRARLIGPNLITISSIV